MAGVSAHNNPDFSARGGFAISGGLIGYHVFKNPAWFAWGLGPVALLSLFTLYSAFYGDRTGIAGLGAGYLAFLLAL